MLSANLLVATARMLHVWHIRSAAVRQETGNLPSCHCGHNTTPGLRWPSAPLYLWELHAQQSRNPYVNFKSLRVLPSEATETETLFCKQFKKHKGNNGCRSTNPRSMVFLIALSQQAAAPGRAGRTKACLQGPKDASPTVGMRETLWRVAGVKPGIYRV